jgi:hypothetical protein
MDGSKPAWRGYSLAALAGYAACFEVLVFLILVGSQIAAQARYLDVAWTAVFAVTIAGPAVIALGTPAAVLVTSIVWRRRSKAGAVRVFLETVGVALAVWSVWGTGQALAFMGLGIGFTEMSMRAAISIALALSMAGAMPATLAAWLLHSGRLQGYPAPIW